MTKLNIILKGFLPLIFTMIATTGYGQLYIGDSIVTPEKMPEFPGGMAKCMMYLGKNLKYPEEAMRKGEHGKVILSFVVERNGSIKDVKVISSVSPSIDKEAIRVVKRMPKWNPGILNGKPIRTRYTLPILFRHPEMNRRNQFDRMAEFPGGQNACFQFLREHIKYPEEAKTANEHGRVVVSFLIDEMGDISDIKIKNSVGYYADQEAIRLVRMMPRWIPATKNGKAVQCRMSLPITF